MSHLLFWKVHWSLPIDQAKHTFLSNAYKESFLWNVSSIKTTNLFKSGDTISPLSFSFKNYDHSHKHTQQNFSGYRQYFMYERAQPVFMQLVKTAFAQNCVLIIWV